jgi:hypothetical protein
MLRTTLCVLAVSLATLLAPSARAGLIAQDATPIAHQTGAGSDILQAHQYNLSDTRIAGQDSIHQKVTAWEVTTGTWNGESLSGLSVVLVQTNDDAQSQHTTNCYVSHMATPAQRKALLSAFLASQAVAPADSGSMRVEPAVIKFEVAGHSVIVHLGLVA